MTLWLLTLFRSPAARAVLIALAMLAVFLGYGYSQRLSERHAWQKTLVDYKAQVEQDNQQTAVARDRYDEAMRGAVADLELQAKARQQVHEKVQTVIREVTKYVPASVDKRSVDANVFTRGWVYLHDLPLNTTAGGPAEFPAGVGGDVEAPTGLAASTVARVSASNLDECVRRGEVIKDWQAWYPRAKKQWDDYRTWLPGPTAIPNGPGDAPAKRSVLKLGAPNPFD